MKNNFLTSDIPVLLIGFNRPLEILGRLKELANSYHQIPRIFISIDGPRANNQSDVLSISEITTTIKQYEKFLPICHTARAENLGINKHAQLAISEVFENYEFCTIIEDDVSISPVFYESMCLATKKFLNKDRVYIIGSYSIFEKNNSLISKIFLHKKNNQVNLTQSKIWNNLSKRKQNVWLRRFGKSYDYDIQKSLFLNDGFSLAPLYRISTNTGMGHELATHTKFPKPWYIFGHGYTQESPVRKIKNSALWNFIDSNTLAGDGYFSSRARTAGVRTLLKKYLNLLTNK